MQVEPGFREPVLQRSNRSRVVIVEVASRGEHLDGFESVRRNLEQLIGMLAKLGLDLTLTTNGSILAKKAQALKAADIARSPLKDILSSAIGAESALPEVSRVDVSERG